MTTVHVYDDSSGSGNHGHGGGNHGGGNYSSSSGTDATPRRIGLAYINQRHARLSSTFAYDHAYLANANAYAISPEFPLQAGNWPALHDLAGAFMDSAPDRWGRNLINKRYPGRRLNNLDYLLGVSDATRQGALRFKLNDTEEFQHPDTKVPKLVALPELLDATRAVDDAKHSNDAVRFLLDAGSGSLGGARPKAVVEKNGRLFLAKFPHASDQTDVIGDEYRALLGARQQGMRVPECALIRVGDANVLLLERFDRRYQNDKSGRVPYISAACALGARDGEQRDYLEIIDFITRFGSRPKADVDELIRRIRYTIEINNTDDHLRNHGFLYEKGGCCLSPLFDINPNPQTGALRQTALGGHTDAEGSLRFLEELG